MIVLEFLGHLLFWFVMIAGIFVIPFGLPGTFLIVANAFVYAWLTAFTELTWKFLGLLLVIAVAVEVIEFFIGAATAGKFGGTKAGMAGAIIGGFLGAIWGTGIVPLLGTLVGAFLGAFVGATLFEYFATTDLQRSVRVGLGAFLGTVGGKLTKIATAVAMVVMIGFQVF